MTSLSYSKKWKTITIFSMLRQGMAATTMTCSTHPTTTIKGPLLKTTISKANESCKRKRKRRIKSERSSRFSTFRHCARRSRSILSPCLALILVLVLAPKKNLPLGRRKSRSAFRGFLRLRMGLHGHRPVDRRCIIKSLRMSGSNIAR